MKYGVYSAKAALSHGTILYENPNGEILVVTAIDNDPDFSTYHWDDKVLLGPVGSYVGEGSQGNIFLNEQREEPYKRGLR